MVVLQWMKEFEPVKTYEVRTDYELKCELTINLQLHTHKTNTVQIFYILMRMVSEHEEYKHAN